MNPEVTGSLYLIRCFSGLNCDTQIEYNDVKTRRQCTNRRRAFAVWGVLLH